MGGSQGAGAGLKVWERAKVHVLCEATYPFAVDRQGKPAAKMYLHKQLCVSTWHCTNVG